MDKASLRKTFLERRLGLSRAQYWTLTEALMDQVKLIDWSNYKTVHVFLPIREQLEVDTFSILNYFKNEEPCLEIVVPRTNFEKLEIVNIRYDHEYTILGRNKQGIPEPIHGKVISADQIDLVFIPLLAYDKMGNRVGYGKGFYDRFLTNCRSDTKKVGLSFFDPVEEIVDLSPYDIRMDACISPGKIWEF